MKTGDASFLVDARAGTRNVELSAYLNTHAAEVAERDAIQWIKSLRHARVDDLPLRDRFTYRGDSLWWFAELYLHRRGVIVAMLKTILALEALIERERPTSLTLLSGGRLVQGIAPQVRARWKVAYQGPVGFNPGALRARLRTELASLLLAVSTVAARCRPAATRSRERAAELAVFVHSAFWRADSERSATLGGDVYIGQVLSALGDRVSDAGVELVGLGPRTSFLARRVWHRVAEYSDPTARSLPLTPIENYAGWRAIHSSLRFWHQRDVARRSLLSSDDLKQAAIIRGCDAWPIVSEELAGVALLQLPWSARTMDEAAAALDAVRPKAAATYAEAGGWGRALVLEARRRRIPVAGLQHGFIYRHWLNYLHEPDEMQPSSGNPADQGFPRPDVTLLYDEYAASHLVEAGHFPRHAVVVTGSPRLDALLDTVRRLTPDEIEATRTWLGIRPHQHLVLVASKFTQIHDVFGSLVLAIATMSDVHLVVKCHPAETAVPYQHLAAGIANVLIVPASTDLATLIAPARLVVTVNSTVAIDAMVLGVPSLVLALPNNLSPFVAAGAMAGVVGTDGISPAVRKAIYDDEHRRQLTRASQAFMRRYAIGSDGQAVHRSADAIMALVRGGMSPTHLASAVQVR